MHGEGEMKGKPHVQQVLKLYAAICDSRIQDVLALVHPQVSCEPLVRPGLTVSYGHKGVIMLVAAMHAAHGRYQFEIGEITEQPGPRVTVQATIVPEPGRNQPPLPVTSVYTFRDGLIISIESGPGASTL
jgi:hypothetical protein